MAQRVNLDNIAVEDPFWLFSIEVSSFNEDLAVLSFV